MKSHSAVAGFHCGKGQPEAGESRLSAGSCDPDGAGVPFDDPGALGVLPAGSGLRTCLCAVPAAGQLGADQNDIPAV